MIDLKIINLAANTTNYGLKKNSTHYASCRNKICGDKIKVEVTSNGIKVKDMRYETDSCIFCQASASTLASIAKNTNFSDLKKNLSKYLNFSKKVPKKFNNLTYLLKEKYMNRKDCILLPFKAFYKAIK